MIGLEHYLTIAATLFVIGIFGLFVNRKNVIILLMSIELMLLAVNINLVAFSSFLGDLVGQVFTLFVLTVAAAEAARRGVNPAQVPFAAIRERLLQQGAQLPSPETSAPAATA